jgi:hypothetical protein
VWAPTPVCMYSKPSTTHPPACAWAGRHAARGTPRGSSASQPPVEFHPYPKHLDIYMAQAPPRLPLRISEILPATGDSPPSAGRGRGVHSCCSDQPNLALLASKIEPPPATFLSNNMFLVKKIRPLANHADFVSGCFLAEKTLLIGRLLTSSNIAKRSSTKSLICWPWHRFNLQFSIEPQHHGPEKK